jgi:hypothetical protein
VATHMYLLRSSTSSKNYLLPLGVAGAIGSHNSPCTSSRHRLARYSVFVKNAVRCCFPTGHASHNCSTCPISNRPRTSSSRASFRRAAMLTCPKCLCQRHTTSSPQPRTARHVDYASLMWRRYKRFTSRFTLANSKPLGSWIFITPVLMSIL